MLIKLIKPLLLDLKASYDGCPLEGYYWYKGVNSAEWFANQFKILAEKLNKVKKSIYLFFANVTYFFNFLDFENCNTDGFKSRRI